MVMEASPSPQSVGREFVRQYYTLLNKAPTHLHRFYNNYSSFVHGGLDAPNRETLPVVGQKQIHNRITQLNFRDCHAKISQVDSQATLGNGVVVQVTGELSNGGAPMRRFTQTFVLAAQSPKKYYVHNDIFRYQDIVFSDEEGSGSRSSGEEEEGAGYFPPPPFVSAPPAFPAPPQLVSPPGNVVAASVSAHVNGLPHDEPARQLVAALQGGAMAEESAAEPELEPEPEPEPEIEHELPAPPPAAPEPKTYANLLKSSAPPPRAPAPSAPAPAPQPPASVRPAPPAHQPHPPTQHAQGMSPGRRYSDAQQLFLGNVPAGASEDALRALFSRFGAVLELRVHAKPHARASCYGFITYETHAAARECLNNAGALYFPDGPDGVKLNVEEKKARGRGDHNSVRRRPHSNQRERDARDSRDPRERDSRDVRDTRERDVRDTREPREQREPRAQHQRPPYRR